MFSGHIFVGFVTLEIQLQNVGISRGMVTLFAPPPLDIPFILSHPVFFTFNLDQHLHMQVKWPLSTLKLNHIVWGILFMLWLKVPFTDLHHTIMYLKDDEKVQITTLSGKGLTRAQVAKELSCKHQISCEMDKKFQK